MHRVEINSTDPKDLVNGQTSDTQAMKIFGLSNDRFRFGMKDLKKCIVADAIKRKF